MSNDYELDWSLLLSSRARELRAKTQMMISMVRPLTRPSATLSPLTRGEGKQSWLAFSPRRGEKVPEGRMRGVSLGAPLGMTPRNGA